MENTMLYALIFVGIFSAMFFLILINTFRMARALNRLVKLSTNETNYQDLSKEIAQIEEIKRRMIGRTQ
jgi:hypothetical protein